jgi:hypothetical protein
MLYYDVASLMTITKTNMIDAMLCSYGTARITGVRIQQQVSRRACAEVSAALTVSCSSEQWSRQRQNMKMVFVEFNRIPNAPL